MSSYLFLWNPSKDQRSFRDYERVMADASAGKPYVTKWICPSRRPSPGDVAYVQRTGLRSNGVFARGVVTQGAHQGEGIQVVGLRLHEFLPIGSELGRSQIVAQAGYDAPWTPMASGNVIPERILAAIERLWPTSTIAKPSAALLIEGAATSVTVTAYERNPIAREKCLQHYGNCCFACGFSFRETYGEGVTGCIHVHHLESVATRGGEHVVDPVKDLRPVCPNCHAVLHLTKPALSIEE